MAHLPSKREFVELRTNRNKYKISDEEGKRLAKAKIGIVGLSVGNSVTMAITLERGCGELRIADLDTIELSNLNRIQAGVHTIGISKAVLAARQIAEIDPFLKVSCFTEGVTENNISEFFGDGDTMLDIVIDECDSIDIKILIREEARKRGIPVVMATSERGMLDVERFDLEPELQIFHGLVGDINPSTLRGLTTEEKIPYVLKILGVEAMSARMRASMLEIGNSIKTWPQLASGVMLGGATVADTTRRILLGEKILSGRYFVDFEKLIPAQDMLGDIATEDGPIAHVHTVPLDQQFFGARYLEKFSRRPNTIPLTNDTVRALVAEAISAPSGGNTQPWLWLYKDSVLLLMLDWNRSTTALDFGRTASIAALGAAAENLVLAAHHRGFEVGVRILDDNSKIAAFEFSHQVDFFEDNIGHFEEHDHDMLYENIGTRQTNRRLGSRQKLSTETLDAIRGAAETIHGAKLSIISSDDELAKLGAMLGATDRMRMLNKRLHEEMMKEMRFTEEEALKTRDGISIADLDLGPLDQTGLMLCRDWETLSLVRRWGSALALEKMSQKAIKAASAAALLTVPMVSSYPTKAGFFVGGRAMQRAWLTATSLGVALQPMSALPYLFARHSSGDCDRVLSFKMHEELSRMRPEFEKLFCLEPAEGRSEVLLFRLAVADAPSSKSFRRGVNEVLSF